MSNIITLNASKRRELAIKKLSIEEFGTAYLGFPAWGGYLEEVEQKYNMMKTHFVAFWGDASPLVRADLAAKAGI